MILVPSCLSLQDASIHIKYDLDRQLNNMRDIWGTKVPQKSNPTLRLVSGTTTNGAACLQKGQ